MNISITQLFLVSLIVISTGCSTPGQRARAHQAYIDTQQDQDWHELQLSEARATAPERIAANRFYIWFGASVILAIGTTTTIAYGIFVISSARAVVAKAQLDAELVYMDPTTHHFPARYFTVKGRLFLVNPNTGQVKKLDVEADPHPVLTAGSQRTQIASILRSDSLLIEGGTVDDAYHQLT